MEKIRRKTQTKRKIPFIKTLFVTMFATVALAMGGFSVAYGDAGQVPDHGKSLIVNEDGTYTLALSVTGDAEKVAQPVNTNVIVILDTSGSMDEDTGNTETIYTPSNRNANNMYGTNDGETYFPIYRHGNWWDGYYYTIGQSAQSQRYTGQRYFRQVANQSRLEAAQDAINGLAEALLSKNGQDGNPDNLIEMALVTFANNATTARTPTTSLTQFRTAVNNTDADGGTNWEAGLRTANNINFGDDDQTFVIFVSDGNPTFYIDDRTGQRGGTGYETPDNIATSYDQAVPAAQALAGKVTASNFFTIGAYGNVDRMEDLTTDAGAPAANYFSAEDTAALQEALASILEKIEMAGIAEAELVDGTTNQVATASSGTVSLLSVDEDSFKYYRAGGTTDGGGTKYNPEANTATTADGTTLKLGEEWTGSEVPHATFEDSAVNWDLSPIGVLEDDVTYTVTFNVWPSQTTLDYIADIENGLYSTLPDEVKQYINEDGELQTNTTATLSYTDTRTGESGSDDYVNPEPVSSTAVKQLTVAKVWQNAVDGQQSAPIDLEVTRDGTHKYDVILSSDNDWKGSIYISIGIMRTGDNGDMEILTPGHDFTFVEPEDVGYRWELDVPVVHPMLIDGELTMLTKVDAAHPAPSGADTYTINGVQYFASDSEEAALTATNYRRSQLVLTKEVDGEGYPEDTTFPFTLSVTNSKAAEGSAENLDSDYYVWFTTIDDNGDNTDDVTVTGATAEEGAVGWYYAASGASVSVDLPAGYSVRFINLPKDSTYSFVEGTLGTGFKFDSAELTEGTDESFEGDQTSTGTIADWNTEFVVTYTNKYELVNVTVDKVWDDSNNQDQLRPNELELTLGGLPEGTTAPDPTIEKSTDGNTWTYTWTGLPKFDASGEAIEYKVKEATVPTGYEIVGDAEVGDKGTITNKHTPKNTTVTVTKEWDDADDQDGIRPDSVTVQLMNGDTAVGDPVTLPGADGKWEYKWENLPANTAVDGQLAPITYSIAEIDVPEGYESEAADPAGSVDAGWTIAVTNTHTPSTTSFVINKVWVDDNNRDGVRPTAEAFKTYLKLKADGTDVTSDYANKLTVTTNDDGSFTCTWADLPEKANGTAITYTAEESEITGYTTTGSPASNNGTITNTHQIDTTTVTVEKIWVGPEAVATIHLQADGENYGDPITLPNGEDNTYTWNDLPKNKNVNGSVSEIEYTVVEDDIDGYEKGDVVEVGDNSFQITNTYLAEGEIQLTITKKLEGRTPKAGEFNFELTAVTEGAPLPETTSAQNAANGDVAFDKITFTQEDIYPAPSEASDDPGADAAGDGTDQGDATEGGAADEEASGTKTFTYEIVESAGQLPRVTYSTDKITVTVTVTDKGDGELEVTAAYNPEDKTIINTYEATGDITFSGSKVLTGDKALEADEFEFVLKDADGKEIETVKNDADGNFSFTKLEFDQTQVGEAKYSISEIDAGKTGYTYDTTVYEITVTISDEGTGELIVTAEGAEEIVFNNTYTKPEPKPVLSDPPVQKIVKGNPPTSHTFTFQMKADDPNAPMPEGSVDGVKTVQITGSGSNEFGNMYYYEPGEFMYELSEVNDGAEGYTYDTTKYFLAVVVTEDAEGNLSISEAVVDSNGNDADHAVFTNVYNEEPVVPKTGDDLAKVVTPLGIVAAASGLLVLGLGVGRRMRKDR